MSVTLPAHAEEGRSHRETGSPSDQRTEPSPPHASSAAETHSPHVALPRVLDGSPALYPPEAMLEGREAFVELIVTVQADGSVGRAEVAKSGGSEFDRAALTAISIWRFAPAEKDGVSVSSRIRVPFHFLPPHAAAEGQGQADHGHVHAHAPEAVATPQSSKPEGAIPPANRIAIDVHGQKQSGVESKGAADFSLDATLLQTAPAAEGADVLRAVPGLYVGRGEGTAVAHNLMLRGFDAEHGQDIEIRVGGIPINLPSHIHGQGYTDLNFLTPGVVRRIQVKEGVYDPSQGDFAVAGSLWLDLGVDAERRGIDFRSSFGSFGTFSQSVLVAPVSLPDESFASGEFRTTDGFGENRAGQSGRVMVQHAFGEGAFQHRILALAYTSQASMAGFVRRDDVAQGTTCFYCVYDYPSTRAQGAQTSRFLAGLSSKYHGHNEEQAALGVWLSADDFRLLENLTGFLGQPPQDGAPPPGDLIEQRNRVLSLGFTGEYAGAESRPLSGLTTSFDVGMSGRLDSTEQAQALVDASQNGQPWALQIDASILGVDLGLYADVKAKISSKWLLRAGLRGDFLTYNVSEVLFGSSSASSSLMPEARRTAVGAAIGPRTSLEFRLNRHLTWMAAYGQGYRSPQALTIQNGLPAPFTKVHSFDLGLRLAEHNGVSLNMSGFYTHLSDDLVFEAAEGALESIGPSERLGGTLNLGLRTGAGFTANTSVTYTDARLVGPPPAAPGGAEEPFTPGARVPYAPPIVARLDLGYRHAVGKLGAHSVIGRTGVGASLLSPRPLPTGEFTEAVGLVDFLVGAEYGAVRLDLEVFNALNARYAAVEYAYVSNFNPSTGAAAGTEGRHTAAGAPLSVMVSLGLHL